MARKTGIGHQDFETVRRTNNFYVDKTDFIREWWESNDIVTLIARPRRFGKTLNMSMLEKFFSIEYAGRGDLFEGLSIWKKEEYRKLQGTYPVISVSFANVKGGTYEVALDMFAQILIDLYNSYYFLLESDILTQQEKGYFASINDGMTDAVASMSLKRLAICMEHYYGKHVIILLDEYDTPMQEAYMNGYWEEMVSFIKNLFNATFKTNPCLERAVLTGITRVSKESVFSDLNNLRVVTTTSEEYAECFGFTEQEVFDALDEFGLSGRRQEVKKWYDGFTFGKKTDIYNPWSVLYYLSARKVGAYWANTSSNGLVGKLVQEGNKNVKLEFETLLRGGTIPVLVDEQIVFSQLLAKKDALWNFLLATGYLKVAHTESVEPDGRSHCQLALTNWEVQTMFEDLVLGWFESGENDYYNDFIKALMLDDVDAMNEYMNRMAGATFSYFDTGKKPSKEEPERFYHGFVLGLMVDLAGRYVLISNRESGFGRYDVMLEPKKREDDAIIMEFKVFRPAKEKDLQETVASALAQIEEKNYAASLLAKGIPQDKIRCYGFAFQGKTVLIGRNEEFPCK